MCVAKTSDERWEAKTENNKCKQNFIQYSINVSVFDGVQTKYVSQLELRVCGEKMQKNEKRFSIR